MRYLLLALIFAISFYGESKTTRHVIQLESGPLSYEAIVGTLPAKNREGVVKGEIGYTAYIKEGGEGNRPITFAFNGGPGSSSILLHLEMLGPRRALMKEEGQSLVPPYQLIDNLETTLDLTDLVFIDPIGTGFSTAQTKEDAKAFYGITEDIRSVGDFIHDFITAHKRWNSPKYLAGESYGTLRAVGLAEYLQNEHSMYFNGVVLISCAIDFQTFFFTYQVDNQLPFFLYLPTYAATAWYHGKYQPEAPLQKVIEDATRFSHEKYIPFLIHPSSFNKIEREMLYDELSHLTGLSLETVRRSKGKIGDDLYLEEFFAEEDKVLGVYDTRLVGDPCVPGGDRFAQNPSVSILTGIIGGAFRHYLQTELEFSPDVYKILSMEAHQSWNFFSYSPWGYPNLLNSLRGALVVNPELKIFVASGYYDCVTPFGATEYCFEHLNLPESYYLNIQMENYEGGHMFYLTPSARKKFKQDLTEFYQKKNP